MKRVLVAGLGLIGARHAAMVEAHAGCQLVGVIDPVAAQRAAFDVPGFDRIEDVDVKADGIILATPTQLHAEHAEAADARGWPMLIEKPVAHSLSDAARISALACPTLVGHHRRHHASVHHLKHIVKERIGAPIVASCIWAMRKPDDYFAGSWRDGHSGSPILINLVHDIDVLRFILGEVVEVLAMGAAPMRDAGRVESGGVLLRFASGAIASIVFADTAASPWGFEAATGENPNIATTGQDMLWITGQQGGVSFPSLTIWGGASDWGEKPQAVRETAERTVPLIAQLDHFCAVMDGSPPIITAADATETLRVALAAQEAAQPQKRAA